MKQRTPSPTVQRAPEQQAPGAGAIDLDLWSAQQGLGNSFLASVQMSGGGSQGDSASVRARAAQGVSGSGTSLPFLDRIQGAFGRHDISGVRAHVGGKAAEATGAIGADAFATGEDIAFGGVPDLWLAAHEAAHVVQQRGGVQLSGGVGSEGDAYEKHADAVADCVVANKSAESLLDRYAGQGSGGKAVQLHPNGAGPQYAPPPPPGYKAPPKSLKPTAQAVKAGAENGGVSIPSPLALFTTSQSNFTRYAEYCRKVQADSLTRAKTTGVPGLKNPYFTDFAESAGESHRICTNGVVAASVASGVVGRWAPALQASQDRWIEAKNAADEAGIDLSNLQQVQLEGEYLQADVDHASQDTELSEERNLDMVAKGLALKTATKSAFLEATTNFEQQQAALTQSRSGVTTAHQAAASSITASMREARANQKGDDEKKLKQIQEFLTVIGGVQSAVQAGMGTMSKIDTLDLGQVIGDKANAQSAGALAASYLRLTGELSSVEARVKANITAINNIDGVSSATLAKAQAGAFANALAAFRAAATTSAEAARRYGIAHEAFAEEVNLVLKKKQGGKLPGGGIAAQMKVLAKITIAAAATTNAVSATNQAAQHVGTLAGITTVPSPDVCKLRDLMAAQKSTFGSAKADIASVQTVLTARNTALQQLKAAMSLDL